MMNRLPLGSLAGRTSSTAASAARRLHATTRRRNVALTWTATEYGRSHEAMTAATATDSPAFVDNAFVASAATEFFDVHDPATNELVTRVPQQTETELAAAVASAAKAFPAWRDTSIMARQQIMFRFTALVRQHHDRLAASISLEQGKTFADARGDVLRGLQVAEAACGAPELLKGEVLEVARDMETRSYRAPLGVTAAICPFNFPAMIPLWCLPLACVTGNTLVMKPSERTPGAALVLAELAREAGLPAGVLSIVHGGRPTVDALLAHPDVRAVSFVGGNAAGEYIAATGAARGKRVQANLGAKNHAVVLPDADRAHVVRSVVGAAFGAAGQRCMALGVVVLVGAAQQWLPDIVAAARDLRLAAAFDADVDADLGPVISPQSRARIEGLVQSAVDEGAALLLDGRGVRPAGDAYARGNWVAPTVIADVAPHMSCYRNEIFGPVLVCLRADSLDDAVALVNRNPYGNGAAVFTRDGVAAERFRRTVDAGQVGINVPIPVPLPMFSFTGNKKSIAAGGASTFYGRPGIAFYTQQKTVTSLWRAPDHDTSTKADVAMPTQT